MFESESPSDVQPRVDSRDPKERTARRLRVLVVDPSTRNQRVLRESLPKHGVDVLVAASGEEGLELARALEPDVVLAEARLPDQSTEEFIERLGAGADPHAPMVLLMTQDPLPAEVDRWLRLGAQDVMRKPMFVTEIAERVKMVVRRRQQAESQHERKAKQAERLSEPQSLIEFVEVLSAERRSLTLLVYDTFGRTGTLGLKDGNVVYAELNGLRGEKAAYTILGWDCPTWKAKEGVPEEENIHISTIALILESLRWREAKRELLDQLPSAEGPYRLTARFTKIQDGKRLPSDVRHFLRLVDGKRTVPQVLAESPYDERETLEKLVKMVQKGVIEPVVAPVESVERPKGSTTLRESEPEPSRERLIGEHVAPRREAVHARAVETPERWILLIGSDRSGRSQVMQSLAHGQPIVKELKADDRAVRLNLGTWENGFGLLELNTKEVSEPLLHLLLPRLSVAVLLTSVSERQRWEYTNYLYQTLRDHFDGPVIIAVNGPKSDTNALALLRETLQPREDDRLIFLPDGDITPLHAAIAVMVDLANSSPKAAV